MRCGKLQALKKPVTKRWKVFNLHKICDNLCTKKKPPELIKVVFFAYSYLLTSFGIDPVAFLPSGNLSIYLT
jgi:hypothetical protein